MPKHENSLGDDDRPRFFLVKNGAAHLTAPAAKKDQVVRLAARSLSVMQKEALVVSSKDNRVWRLVSDEGSYLDGCDEAPCPLSFLTTGMVSSYMNELLALADQRDMEIMDICIVQDNYYTMHGSALKGTMVGGARDIGLDVQIDTKASKDTVQDLIYDAVSASPLNGLMQGEKESLFTLTHNGKAVDNIRALPLGAAHEQDPSGIMDNVKPDGEWDGLIRRAGMSPKTDEITSSQGSSYSEHQDRTLHVRGICKLRDDGVKQIEQQLFNPHGSVFHFLCDEEGRAPNAESYMATGIGFCFMTQLGRYAKIAKKDLHAYNIVQDIHFSWGGASGGTGKAGSAEPVETHVFLESDSDDRFAQTALDMGEQTCFLHAFCRTDLKAKVRVTQIN
ncbi:MAG: OsmC family protein [Hyphomonadaceae bacterium]|nr:OsmC family protein [Hyphomonadaceae bacterium]MBC6412200.1 OsmC family protein [Hyphomonadaceae bacterium]